MRFFCINLNSFYSVKFPHIDFIHIIFNTFITSISNHQHPLQYAVNADR